MLLSGTVREFAMCHDQRTCMWFAPTSHRHDGGVPSFSGVQVGMCFAGVCHVAVTLRYLECATFLETWALMLTSESRREDRGGQGRFLSSSRVGIGQIHNLLALKK